MTRQVAKQQTDCYNADGDVTFAGTHDSLHIVSFASDSDLSIAAMKKCGSTPDPIASPS
jgi:hypothetical protein